MKLNLGKTLILYLEPGEHLKLECGWANPLDTARFEGPGAEINRYLQQDCRESEAVSGEFTSVFYEESSKTSNSSQ
jgi:hypothetical protein